jgi:cytochrome c peroxidase
LAALETDPLNSVGKFSDGSDGRTPDKLSSDLEGAFRTPRLRCVAGRPSFMRNGQMRSLEEVVTFFDRGGDRMGFPGKTEIEPLGLSELERADLVAFLKSLDGPGPAAELLSP